MIEVQTTSFVPHRSGLRLLAAWAAACLSLPVHTADALVRPTIVVFITDDQPQSVLGIMGNARVATPSIDRLATHGVLFENSFVTTSICAVSRASLLTGQHMSRHGINSFDRPLSAEQWALTFPVLLRSAGYRTAFLGKLAIGSPHARRELSLPADRFDTWYGFPQDFTYKQEGRYVTTVMEQKAVTFLREQPRGVPFLLVMALKEPHGPHDMEDPELPPNLVRLPIPRPKTMSAEAFSRLPAAIRENPNAGRVIFDVEKMARIYRYISRADIAVGRIAQALHDLELDGDTVVIFTSGNGQMHGAHRLIGNWNMYEESIRVPLIIRDPRLPVRTRGRRPQMALNIDLAPTVLALAGVPVPATMQGRDLGPILRDPAATGREDWYYEHDTVVPNRSGDKPLPRCEGVRTKRWKYIRYKGTRPLQEELFNLAQDPLEKHDIAGNPAHAETLALLRDRCDEYRRTLK